MIFSVPTIQLTQQAKELCSQAANQTTERRSLNPHKCSNYIFHTGSFPIVVSYFHKTVMLAAWT